MTEPPNADAQTTPTTPSVSAASAGPGSAGSHSGGSDSRGSGGEGTLGASLLNRLVLGRSLRAMIVLPAVVMTLYFGFHTASGALMGMFAVVAMLLMADFGGRPRRRLISYLVTMTLGALTLSLGTLVNGQEALVVLVGMALGFGVNLTGVLRGPVARASLPVLLPFMVTAVGPNAHATYADNMLGWVVGCVASTAAALLLWPTRAGRALQDACADALDAAADTAAALYPVRSPDALAPMDQLEAAVRGVNATYEGRLLRPAGSIGRDRGLVNLIEDIYRLRSVLVVRAHDPNPTDSTARSRLAETTESTLREIAAAMRSGEDTIDLEPLLAARRASYRQLESEVGHGLESNDPEANTEVSSHFSLRLASLLTVAAGTDAKLSLGTRMDDPRVSSGVADITLPRWQSDPRQMLLAQLNPTSPWFRNSARQAVAIGMSLLVAMATGVSHGFWVVLGTISSLRFDAVGTGRTVRDAFVGTALGFVAGSLVLHYLAGSPALWLMLPPLAFLAAYTRSIRGLWLSQFAFTLLVITALAAMAPEEHGIAAVRLIDVSLGLAISLLCSLLLWPRGVLPAVRESLIAAINSSTSFLLSAVDRMVGGAVSDDDLEQRSAHNWRSQERAAETFDLALIQRTPEDIPRRTWVRAVGASRHVTYAATLISAYPVMSADERYHTRVIGPLLAATHAVQQNIDEATLALLDAADAAIDAGVEPDSSAYGDPRMDDPEVLERLELGNTYLMDLRAAIDSTVDTWSAEIHVDEGHSPAVVPMVLELEQSYAWLEHLELTAALMFARAKLVQDAADAAGEAREHSARSSAQAVDSAPRPVAASDDDAKAHTRGDDG